MLIEFKRPERDDYTDVENPIKQAYRYMDRILDGTARQKDGRRFHLRENTPFYVYIVCDVTPLLRSLAEREEFLATFDGQGFFRYHSFYRAYIEIISFEKLLSDAKKRNRAFFERLNLPCD